MRAIQIESFGGPEILSLKDLPEPEPGPDELLVELHAAGVNRVDILTRTGAYHGGTTLPIVLGREGAGVVRTAGAAVAKDFHAGDRVLVFRARPGCYAERVAVPATRAVKIPEALGFGPAAALPVAWLSAWYSLVRLAKLGLGETILIQGGASGVGQAALEIAKHLGARAIATAGAPDKLAFAREAGAVHAIDYATADVTEEVLRFTEGKGVDVVLDAVGGRAFRSSLRSLGHGGRCVALANVALEESKIDTRDFYPKNATILGFQINNLMDRGFDPRDDLRELARLCAAGALRVHVDRVFPLEEAAAAHRWLEERRSRGKVLLAPAGAEVL